ncbi:hypothetical protein [Haloprofundus halobius]|uniref:hypothetical protein n=1 Tax=Haloprofundus halobius TaxID=2876194 RepID=UPI001CC98D67|nr:hypothetical protein [Haloprofundus halobius]
MMWQDLIFLAGSVFSLLVLVPTVRDSTASIPLGTSLPSASLGVVYGTTFLSLGMTMSAVGSLLTCVMWGVIATLRSPHPFDQYLESNADEPSPRAAPQYAD